MRIPGSEVYRAFPELDQFSDAQCREYVHLVRRRRWAWWVLAGLLQIVFALAGMLMLIVAVIVLTHDATNVGGDAVAVVVIVAATLPTGLLVMLTRDFVLRRAIRWQLARVDCHRCRYTLLGMPVVDGSIICPECGFVLELDKYGLTGDDFIAAREE